MLKTFEISNYKSLAHLKLDLGRLNVFIGENGAGKTNIVEGLAFVAAVLAEKTDTEDLINRGIRVAPPEITMSAFRGHETTKSIVARCKISAELSRPAADLAINVYSPSTSLGAWQDRAKPKFPLKAAFAILLAKSKNNSNLDAILTAGAEGLGGAAPDAATRKELQRAAAKELAAYQAAVASRSTDLTPFAIYSPNSLALRGLQTVSHRTPIGIYGEDLDVAFAALPEQIRADVTSRAHCINWFDDVLLDPNDDRKRQGAKPGRSRSRLYFRDRFMAEANAEFSAENANEGILYLMFYLTLFSSPDTPKIFGIDNIETALNPQLCRDLTTHLAELTKRHDKQALITTHNPAILDGLDLADDDQRLFVVERDDEGHTVARRIRTKPANPAGAERQLKLSEMWMRGLLGGIPERF
jgi:predicted ATPase